MFGINCAVREPWGKLGGSSHFPDGDFALLRQGPHDRAGLIRLPRLAMRSSSGGGFGPGLTNDATPNPALGPATESHVAVTR